MIRQDLHMHTIFDDGKDTCRAMLDACREKGMQSAGITLHSPLPFANDWAAGETGPFLAEMVALKAGYAGRLQAFAGLELDALSADTVDPAPFDYVIGSVHHLPFEGGYLSVDNTPEETDTLLREAFGGDADAMAEAYYREVARVAALPQAQICGHFDLITKFNEKHPRFDPESPRYRAAALSALEAVVKAGKIVEINTGALSRGWRTAPYPAKALLAALREMGGRVMFTSDAHSVAHVGYAFREAAALAMACGFTEYAALRLGGANPVFEQASISALLGA